MISRSSLPRVSLLLAALLALLAKGSFAAQSSEAVQGACIVITGLGGIPEYEENFEKWGDSLRDLCAEGEGIETHLLDGRTQRKDEVLALFGRVATRPGNELWLFLIGHGSHDGRNYKFNIRGPDLTDRDLARFLDSMPERRKYVVAATSSSGALTTELEGPRRVVVTATKSEREKRPPLFMSFFIEGTRSAEADVNKDGRVALGEAFQFTQSKVQQWYEEKGRIQTEHPVLEESQESQGLAELAYLSSPPEQAYRTLEAQNLAPDKQRIEREIEDLKLRKNDMPSSDYYQQLEQLLIDLATVNERIRELEGAS